MSLTVQLLGRPRIEHDSGPTYRFRSQKSWGLLAYLLLSQRPCPRAQTAGLLFEEADDPLRALRWSLAEIRRGLGPDATVEGDPLVVTLPEGAVVDVDVVARGAWTEAVTTPGLGEELLAGLTVRGAAGFEVWLEAERQRLAAAAESILHEAALGSLSAGLLETALDYALRAAQMSPLDENHEALVIRLLRRLGDDRAAQGRYDAMTARLAHELDVTPGIALDSALRGVVGPERTVRGSASIAAVVEAGAAAVAAGAVDAGVESLRTAVHLADADAHPAMRITARVALGEALVHSLRGMDEEGLAAFHSADRIAEEEGDRASMARVRAELGYVDFLRARYDRACLWLTDAMALADGSPGILAKATTYLGSVESDRADYSAAFDNLAEAIRLARIVGDVRLESFAMSMCGRAHLLRGHYDEAASCLNSSIELAEADRWLAMLPWPQALRGEVELARGDFVGAAHSLEQSFARACQLGDPCWEGMAARGLALTREAAGDVTGAFELLADARIRCNRLADPYVWLDVYILDALCEVGRRHRHPETARWIDSMRTLASRTAMRELTVRSLIHGAAMGAEGDAEAAVLLADGIDNPLLDHALATLTA